LLTAKVGSFSAAAEKLFISASAVNQQITCLEDSLGVKLFKRSRHGLSLTPAGRLLQSEAPSFLSHAEHIRSMLSEVSSDVDQTLLVGIPHMHNIRLFYDYWTKYSRAYPSANIKLAAPATWKADEVFKFYAQCDIVEYVDIYADWMKDRSFIRLCDMPVSLAVPKTHPKAGKDRFAPQDLNGSHIICVKGAFTRKIKPGLDLLESAGAEIEYLDHYSSEMLNNCLLNNYLTVVLELDPKIPASFRVIPCTWGINVPYGFSVKKNGSRSLQQFVCFVEELYRHGE